MNINGTVVRRGAVTAFAVAAMAAALGACSTGQTGAAAPGAQAPAPVAGSGADQGNPHAGMRNLSATNEQDGSGVARAGNEIPCTHLKVTTSQPKAVNDTSTQWQFPIMLTNTSDATCEVRGFPGVRLDGADGTTWDLTRTSKPIAPVVLRPGEHADADLTYLTDDSGSGWKVSAMAVTPPNTTDMQVVTWAAGSAIVKQDGATHPGTYIDPVRQGPK